jgi:hypothetical protein
MITRTKLAIPMMIVVSLTLAIEMVVAMAVNVFPTQSAYAQGAQPSPGTATPTYSPPSGNSTATNSTSSNATK